MFFENKEINPFMGRRARSAIIDDVNGDNFDHSGLGFLGGSRFACGHGDGRPIGYRPVPPGTPRWGAAWKTATAKWYSHAANIAVAGSNYANRNNYLDLDPTYKDQLGRPLLRLTYNFVENDYKVMEYTLGVAAKIARAMNPTIMGEPRMRRGNYDIVPYQSTHNTGGTIMGTDLEDKRGQPLSAIVGRRQSVHYGRFDVSAEPATTRLDRWERLPIGPPRRSSPGISRAPVHWYTHDNDQGRHHAALSVSRHDRRLSSHRARDKSSRSGRFRPWQGSVSDLRRMPHRTARRAWPEPQRGGRTQVRRA